MGRERDPVCVRPDDKECFHCYLAGAPVEGAFGLPALPTAFGVYGERYWPSMPRVLVSIPFDALSESGIGGSSLFPGRGPQPSRVWVVAMSSIAPQPSQKLTSHRTDEINVVTHYWVHGEESARWGIDALEASISIGAVCCQGVEELYMDHVDGGLPCTMVGPSVEGLHTSWKRATRSVTIHGSRDGGIALSPNNCQFGLVAADGTCAAMIIAASRVAMRGAGDAGVKKAAVADMSAGIDCPSATASTSDSSSRFASSPAASDGKMAAITIAVLPKDADAEAALGKAIVTCEDVVSVLGILASVARASQPSSVPERAVSVASVLEHLQHWAAVKSRP